MPRRNRKQEHGVFEKDPGAEIWWIRYYIDGRERREKVGRKCYDYGEECVQYVVHQGGGVFSERFAERAS